VTFCKKNIPTLHEVLTELQGEEVVLCD